MPFETVILQSFFLYFKHKYYKKKIECENREELKFIIRINEAKQKNIFKKRDCHLKINVAVRERFPITKLFACVYFLLILPSSLQNKIL